MSDELAQIFRLLCAVRSPHRSQQRMMSDDLPWMPGEVNQQVELFRRQVNFVFLNLNPVRWNVDKKVPYLDYRSLGLKRDCGPPECSADSGQQFVHIERLGDVIVGSGIE